MMEANGISPSSAMTLLGTFTYTERILYDPQGSYIRNMMYQLVLVLMQMPFIIKFLMPLLLNKKEIFASVKLYSKEFAYNILDIFARVGLVSLAGIVGNFGVLCVLKRYFSLPLRGDLAIYSIFMIYFIFNMIVFCIVIAAIIKKIDYFAIIFLILNTMFVFTGGVTYPFYMMPEKLRYFVKLLSPQAQVAVPLKVLNLKGVGWNVMLTYLKESISYTILWLLIGIVLYYVSILIIKYKNRKVIDRNNNLN